MKRMGIDFTFVDPGCSDEELEARRQAWVKPAPKYTTGVLGRYAKLVSSADKGAYFE